ncbi:MAG: nucleotide exchange factor GrpE [Longimicrobiales bacterium]
MEESRKPNEPVGGSGARERAADLQADRGSAREPSEAAGRAEPDGDVATETGPGLDELQAEIEALNDRHLRLAAEFDNYRKRVDRERAETRSRAQAELIGRVLDGLDDLERVSEVDVSSTTVDDLMAGVQLVEKKLRQAFEAAGLEIIRPVGEPFDPATMDALMTVPTADADEDDQVADVFQPGYRFHGALVRPAKVRVKKHEP